MARDRILVPLDGSEASRRILPHIRKFFPPERTDLILFRVGIEPSGWATGPERPVSVSFDGSVYPPGGNAAAPLHPIYATQEEDSRRARIEEELRDDIKDLKARGYTVSVEVRFGKPADEIIAFATSSQIDLVAMTTHGRTGLNRLVAGSVAEEIVRRVGLPILVLRPFRGE